MKTLRILTLAAAVLTLAACGNEEFIENNPGNEAAKPVPMTFTAGMPQTRTQLAAGNEVHWSEGDKIALWDGPTMREFTAETINGSEATFTGEATPGANYTAFYPLSAVVEKDGLTIHYTVPAEQTAVAGTFANQLAPSVAKATGGSTNLVFENLCALVKFTVHTNMAGEGTFTLVGGNATEALAGKLSYNTLEGDLTATEPATRITLTGNFTAGKDYYFVVMPGFLADGFSLLYEDSKSKLYRKATGNSVTLQAGHILNLGPLALTGFDKAVAKEIYAGLESGTATENADGTVTLSNADLTALAGMTKLELTSGGLTSLAGLGYCTGLEELDLGNNKLTELNLSELTNLKRLRCYENQLTTLDVSMLTKLNTLICYNNKLTSLDVSKLTKLTTLKCYKNQLTTLDITPLTKLTDLICGYQKSGSLTLVLTLTSAQKSTWDSEWGKEYFNTRNVTLDVKP